jgi:endonuclease/exonuclease/phosphatase (EEP) superfamily protein YafD
VILLFFLSVVMAVKRRWWLVGITVICMAVHLFYILPVYLSPRESLAGPKSETVKILTSNVRRYNTHHQPVLDLISKETPDVVTLQELDDVWLKDLKPLNETYPYRRIIRMNYRERLALYSRLPIITSQEKNFGSFRIPVLITTLDVKGHHLVIYTTHLTSPSTLWDARARNQALLQLAQEIHVVKEPAILIGDMNISPWSPYFYDLLRTSGLKDSREGFGIQASWPTYVPLFLIPVDHCLVHPSIQVLDRRIGPKIGSDHYPILIKLAVPDKSQAKTTPTLAQPPSL